MNQFSYRPGTWQVVVEDGGVVAVPGDVATDRLVRLTRMLRQGTPALTDVIDVLAAGSIATLGSFAVALTPGGAVRFAVRGPVTVRIDAESGAESVSGADVSTWSERYVVDPQDFELVLEEPSGDTALPIRSGVVLAASLRTGETPSAAAPADASASAAAPTNPVEAPPAPVDETPAEQPDSSPALHTLIPSDLTLAPSHDAAEQVGSDESDADVHPPVDATAAVDVPADAQPESDLHESALEHTVHKPSSASAFPPPPPVPPVVPPMPPAPPLGDHDGATISLAEVRRLRAEAGAPAPAAPDAPTELIPTTDAPQAAHGVVRLSTGQVIELDRTVIIGRRPRSTRASGESMPHLVAVDSPQQDISRSHLEIRPEGDSVVVIDLRTTNGSTLLRPGADPVRLHPGEHTLVLSGDVVDLGDGVTVAFEGLA